MTPISVSMCILYMHVVVELTVDCNIQRKQKGKNKLYKNTIKILGVAYTDQQSDDHRQ